jgi:hypothetical protein
MRLTCRYVEPPIGIEPMTYALRGKRSRAAHALAAPIARAVASIALATLGLSDEPVHDRGAGSYHPTTLRNLTVSAASPPVGKPGHY